MSSYDASEDRRNSPRTQLEPHACGSVVRLTNVPNLNQRKD